MSESKELVKNENSIKGFEFDPNLGIDRLTEVAQKMLDTGLVPESFEGNPGGLIAVGQIGNELGFSWWTAINNIDNIKGKPTLSYRAVGALLERNNYGVNWLKDFEPVAVEGGTDYVTEVEIVDYNLLERYKAELRQILEYPEDVRAMMLEALAETKSQIKRRMNYKWSDANNARYLTKDQWSRLPREMMRARCLVSAVRALCPHIMMGLYESTEIDQNIPLKNTDTNSVQTGTVQQTSYNQNIEDVEIEDAA